MSTPVWEQSKENVAPIARGRDVAQLEHALQASTSQRQAEKDQHEDTIRQAADGRGPYANDPLAPWVTYVKWAVTNYPAGSQVVLNAIETPCRAFARDKRYREDGRFVRLWIRYADVRDDQLDVFAYMKTRKIGTKAALFYEGWATTLEFDRQYDEAEKIYALGLELGAKPTERLARRQREFFNRMGARARRKQKKEREALERKKEAAEKAARAPPSRPRSALADSILTQQEQDSDQLHSSSARTSRAALGAITDQQAETGMRPMTKKQPPAGILRSRRNAPAAAGKPPKPPSGGFQIFSDPSPSHVRGSHQDTGSDPSSVDEFPFPSIAKTAEVGKENSGQLPSKWAGETFVQDKTSVRKMQRAAAKKPTEDFEIFQDHSMEEEHVQPDAPEQYVPEQNVPPSQPERPLSPPPVKRLPSVGAVSPTINTKIAMQQVDDMFSSELPMERERDDAVRDFSVQDSPAVAEHSKPASFSIFCDDGDDKENDGQRKTSPSHAGPSGIPALEQRVLQPIPEMEGPFIPASHEEYEAKEDIEMGEEGNKDELMNMLAAWCFQEPTYHFLEGDEPNVDRGMINLHSANGGASTFLIDSVLGEGYEGNSRVASAEALCDIPGIKGPADGDESDGEPANVALKASPNNVWEFYVYKTIHSRNDVALRSVPRALLFFFGAVQSYLVLDAISDSSMSDVLKFEAEGRLSEHVAMFFTIDLLKTLEALHGAGMIHGDVTLDNVMLRMDCKEPITERLYNSQGKGGWGSRGILLVDYNHATDTRHAVLDGMSQHDLARYVSRDGNAFVQSDYRIPNADTWSFNADCYAASVCSRKMLGASELKHSQIWERYFSQMEQMSSLSSGDDSVRTLRECRVDMEQVICDDKWLNNSISKLMVKAMELKNGMDLTLG